MSDDGAAEHFIETPHLNDREFEAFKALFADNPKAYMEFGLGGSSIQAVRHGVTRLVAVDSDPDWALKIRSHPAMIPFVASGDASILHAEIGPVGPWGTPRGRDHVQSWHRYISEPWLEWSKKGGFPELIFVDGRFRAACILSVLLARPTGAAPTVAVHDVSDARPQYSATFKYFDVHAHTASLVVMKPKAMIDRMAVLAEFCLAQFDPS